MKINRWKALLEGEELDRVPVVPWIHGHAAYVCGYENVGDFWTKPEVQIKCYRRAKEMYGYDQPPILLPGNYWAGAWGSEVKAPYSPKMQAPSVTEPAATNEEELENIEVPDPRETMQDLDELLGTALKDGEEYPAILFYGGSVSGTAPIMVELEKFMMWLRTDPEICRKALEKSGEFVIRTAEWLVEKHGTKWVPFDPLPTDANVLIDPESFEDIVLPVLKKVHREVLDLGIPMWITHFCSDWNQSIERGLLDEIDYGDPGVMWFGPEEDLGEMVERFGDDQILLGNVDPPSVKNKSFEDVLQLCKENIEAGKHSPKGYALASGCEHPVTTPPVNTYAYVKASKEYGKY